MSNRLQEAVKGVAPPADLEERVRAAIGASVSPKQRPAWQVWGAVAAALVISLAAAGMAYQEGHLRWTEAAREAYVASVSAKAGKIMCLGLGDHVHCAVFRKYPAKAPAVGQLAHDLGPANADLLPAVAGRIPIDYRLVMAHQCGYQGRKFVHLIFRKGTSELSLLITGRAVGEELRSVELRKALAEGGLEIYQSGAQRFQVAAFETPAHLVYVVSDMTAERNLEVMAAVAHSVKEVLKKSEA